MQINESSQTMVETMPNTKSRLFVCTISWLLRVSESVARRSYFILLGILMVLASMMVTSVTDVFLLWQFQAVALDRDDTCRTIWSPSNLQAVLHSKMAFLYLLNDGCTTAITLTASL